jgi:hypothetical protein
MALDRLFAALEQSARQLAAAKRAELALAPHDTAKRWRSARLVWPLFMKGSP